jgi:hypothetical protein
MAQHSSKAKSAAGKARKAVRDARAKVAEVTPKARAFFEDDDYTPEGKAKYGGGWLREGREDVEAAITPARFAIQDAHAAAVNNLEDGRHVTDEELAARAVILQPVFAAANDNPGAIIKAYEKRAATNFADRRLLEETMQAMADAEIGGLKFQEDAARARDRLELGAEEQDAISEVQYLGEAENYLNSALRGRSWRAS